MDSPRQNPNRTRLQKYLAACGRGSRRACEQLIAAGRVTVNGQPIAKQGVSIDPARDTVKVDGQPARAESKVHILFNKPKDVLCTCHDPGQRRTFLDFLPDMPARLYPVGRLDRDSEGLLILTNDGDLAQILAHPRHHVSKTYRVWTDRALTVEEQSRMVRGVESEGEQLKAATIEAVGPLSPTGCYDMILQTGRNRQIRRMLAAVGCGVRRLRRIRVGPLEMKGLRLGEWRHLTAAEVAALREAAGGDRIFSNPGKGL